MFTGLRVKAVQTIDVNEPRTSRNVVADLPRKGTSDEMVSLGCHYDRHDIPQGAVATESGKRGEFLYFYHLRAWFNGGLTLWFEKIDQP